ncbi:MAG: hypothetical protein [Podoviridae sp. ctrTa16]|nr:MAG: hypothetical protein [Podoviridae sp. ctrTa16]
MSDSNEKIFADGFIFKKNPKAPEFVIGKLSVKVDDAIAFLKNNERNGWVNMDIKNSRAGNPYIELDTYQPPTRDAGNSSGSNNSQPIERPTQNVSNNADDEDGELPF